MKTYVKNVIITGGFTLIETMVAVMILSTSVLALLGLTTNSLFTARYANNEITSNYLLQEVADFVRNDRDTTAFQKKIDNTAWTTFTNRYGTGFNGCFSISGCYIEIAEQNSSNVIRDCPIAGCPNLRYDSAATYKEFYTYNNSVGVTTLFNRTIHMTRVSADEISVSISVSWINGSVPMTRTLTTSFLSWQA